MKLYSAAVIGLLFITELSAYPPRDQRDEDDEVDVHVEVKQHHHNTVNDAEIADLRAELERAREEIINNDLGDYWYIIELLQDWYKDNTDYYYYDFYDWLMDLIQDFITSNTATTTSTTTTPISNTTTNTVTTTSTTTTTISNTTTDTPTTTDALATTTATPGSMVTH